MTGGSSAISGGNIHIGGATTFEEYIQITHGMHDPVFSRAYFDGFKQYTAWLQEIGAAISRMKSADQNRYEGLNVYMGSDGNWESPSVPQCKEYFDSLEAIYEGAGGALLFRTPAS